MTNRKTEMVGDKEFILAKCSSCGSTYRGVEIVRISKDDFARWMEARQRYLSLHYSGRFVVASLLIVLALELLILATINYSKTFAEFSETHSIALLIIAVILFGICIVVGSVLGTRADNRETQAFRDLEKEIFGKYGLNPSQIEGKMVLPIEKDTE